MYVCFNVLATVIEFNMTYMIMPTITTIALITVIALLINVVIKDYRQALNKVGVDSKV